MFVDTRSMPPKALIVTESLKSVSTIPGLPALTRLLGSTYSGMKLFSVGACKGRKTATVNLGPRSYL